MSDFIIPIYKCLYDVPMHYFTVLDIFLEYRDIFTRWLDIFFYSWLTFARTRKGHDAAAGDVNAGPGLNPVFLQAARGLIRCKFERFAVCELNILFANFDVLIM